MTKQEQIDKLQQQIWDIQTEQRKDNKDKLIPFLKKNAVLVWGGLNRLEIKFNSEKLETEAITLLDQASGGSGFYHISVDIDKNVRLCYDDGKCTLSLFFSGKTSEVEDKVYKTILDLGIPISFENALKEAQMSLNKASNEMGKIKEVQYKYLVATAVQCPDCGRKLPKGHSCQGAL